MDNQRKAVEIKTEQEASIVPKAEESGSPSKRFFC